MRAFRPKANPHNGPEAKIQQAIIDRLKAHDWYVKVIVGNAFQFGLPDLFAAHAHWGMRWIEVKNPLQFSFTPAQIQEFPKLNAAGVGVWILFSDEKDELDKLFKPANWFEIYFRWSNSAMARPIL